MATEWLFSVPEHVLEKHLGSDPSTPTADADTSDEVKRSYAPRRSTLNVSITDNRETLFTAMSVQRCFQQLHMQQYGHVCST